jgi:hypothetical protein
MNDSVRPASDRRTKARVFLCASVLSLFGSGIRAQTLSEDAPILGGTAALSRALGIDPAPDRARFVTELTRVIYDTPEGKSANTDALLQRLAKHLQSTDRFQSALAAVQRPGATIELSAASRKDDRNRLKDFLDVIGLKLREKNKVYSVERTDNKQAAERLKLLADLGIDLGQFAARLTKGEAVRVEVPAETVPIPLPVKVWSESVFQRPITVAGLFSAVIADRRAALLCHGLAALDDETLQFLADRPALVTRLYEHEAGAFAAFAGSLRIRHDAIVVPGGSAAAPLWEAVVDEKVGRPDRFIRELFSRRSGRVAYVYDALTQLDAPTRAFALGLWMKDSGLRMDRFKSLLDVVEAYPSWDVPARPFSRLENDPVMMLMRVAVDAGGKPVGPSWRVFWSRAFDGMDLPDDAANQLRHLQDDGGIDAPWLAQAIFAADARFRRERLDQFAFGQRVFAGADDKTLPDVLVAVRAFMRYPMLMLTLERMGIRTPAVYAGAARQAERLSALDANHGFVALSQFQGAIAVVAQLVRTHVVDAARAEVFLASLSAVALHDDGRYAGGIARWVRDALVPAVAIGSDDIDAALTNSLAGLQRGTEAPATRVSWEDRTYRLDLVAPEARRLSRVLQKLRAEPVSRALAVEAVAEQLTSQTIALAEIQSATATLKKILAAFAPAQKQKATTGAELPPGIEAPRSRRDIVTKATQELSKISKPKDAKKAARVAEPLFELVDDVLAEALRSVAYAICLGEPDGMALAAGNVSSRHDFGFERQSADTRVRAAWIAPTQEVQPGVPWRVTGSLLGLDLGLSTLALRRISSDSLPHAPVLRKLDRDTLTKTVALLNAFELRDADRDAIADAIAQGRQRVRTVTPAGAGFDALADDIAMDGWRRRAVRWALANDPEHVLSFFSLTDLLYLGNPSPSKDLNSWGTAADDYDGCLCTRLSPPGRWTVMTGRLRSGTLSTQIADLNLHIALMLKALKLPAALAKGVLAAATQDYVDAVNPLYADDWLTLVRQAQTVSPERIADYVAALTTSGPLVAATAAGRPDRHE